ncbi:unnamed protein product [Didymodactylos carnosus]|uniref:Uncharacterized protein n=1 Tax=Didymodactylos carnosus TaxID=1234261 RepID=A0A815V8T1_9BILA|nr:unnamed protein product [Didymodactylos carnosus]CAF4388994.1 unnamed protein product [Didymodactylos carnosus]
MSINHEQLITADYASSLRRQTTAFSTLEDSNEKFNFEDFLIILLDTSHSHNGYSCFDSLSQLRRIVDVSRIFDNVQKCYNYLLSVKNEKMFLIMANSRIDDKIWRHIFILSQIVRIYILDTNITLNNILYSSVKLKTDLKNHQKIYYFTCKQLFLAKVQQIGSSKIIVCLDFIDDDILKLHSSNRGFCTIDECLAYIMVVESSNVILIGLSTCDNLLKYIHRDRYALMLPSLNSIYILDICDINISQEIDYFINNGDFFLTLIQDIAPRTQQRLIFSSDNKEMSLRSL